MSKAIFDLRDYESRRFTELRNRRAATFCPKHPFPAFAHNMMSLLVHGLSVCPSQGLGFRFRVPETLVSPNPNSSLLVGQFFCPLTMLDIRSIALRV